MKPFYFLYFFTSLVIYLMALPIVVLMAWRKKYRESIPARFWLWKNPPFEHEGIWLHACSLGEVKALRPVIEKLEGEKINITTTTHTGYAEAKKYDADVRYLPYELFLPFWSRRQKVTVILEAEFWYMLFASAARKGSRVLMLNARMTERSFPKYLKMRWLYRRMFAYTERLYVQSDEDRGRFEQLGASSVQAIGNIKLAQHIAATKQYEKPDAEVIVAASTHEGEETPIFSAWLEYCKTHPSKLIVVPRHPERFEAVWKMIESVAADHAISCSRWSEVHNFRSDMILIDAMGELNNIYAISDVAILGGAFKPDVGGHNPLEPSHFGCKIITGEHAFMQGELFKYVNAVQVVAPEQIYRALINARTMEGSSVNERIDLETVIHDIRGNQ